MFEKILSSIGIGSVKVNTVLLEKNIERGNETQGEVHIFGGIAEQKISEIYIHIDSEFHKDDDDTTDFRDITEPILEIKITDPVNVNPHEEKVIPFSFFLPYYTPITFGEQKVTIETEIDINFINHPLENHDFVVCDQWIDDILSYLNERGFKHSPKSGLCRHKLHEDNNPTHCLQTFILMNDQGMKIYFVGNEKDIHIYVYDKDRVRHCPINRDEDLNEQLKKLHLSSCK
jgi:sporulation-control protein spo0M